MTVLYFRRTIICTAIWLWLSGDGLCKCVIVDQKLPILKNNVQVKVEDSKASLTTCTYISVVWVIIICPEICCLQSMPKQNSDTFPLWLRAKYRLLRNGLVINVLDQITWTTWLIDKYLSQYDRNYIIPHMFWTGKKNWSVWWTWRSWNLSRLRCCHLTVKITCLKISLKFPMDQCVTLNVDRSMWIELLINVLINWS